ncbi:MULTISPECIES: gephyrin-like molybdotransferase Glp [Methylomonas]|uniref:Molybdopterin molybdenumtransferase n=2 Tax=Methylomonas TaxID=416 RepID=A0A140E725_9GAMM|nr:MULTISPECIES: gephyrin-like molybdotransferase Glp [Methylomonas]AMK79199.1 molybdopterin molybdenumtransferase [Methylomonas denitrificans]OAH98169.1 molybdopterin molybdenumtransferase MoeA [Methylomonas methanica]TCV86283.1 molybdopterin molybdochelatase [Methylomonas methanica]
MTDICYPNRHNLLSVEQALLEIRKAIEAVTEQELIALPQALDRILADSVVSPMDIPPQRTAAMDGYAFAAGDTAAGQQAKLQVIGTSWAGKPFLELHVPGQCVRIFTGAVVPSFADSVIAQEQVEMNGDTVSLPLDWQPYKNIRAAGSDVKQHEELITAPKKLTARDLSLLAAAGVEKISVKRKLKIGFFSTGDELVPLGEPLAAGQIHDSNRYLLAGLLSDPNHTVSNLGIVVDDQFKLEQTFKSAAQQHDVIISTGGASVGDADFVKQTLEKCGQVNFWKLAIKPGKPLAFGKIGDCWFFGLPGNPVAVLVTYEKFVKPGLEQLAGAPATQALRLRVRCDSALKKSPGRQEYQRGILCQSANGELVVRLAGQQDSHQLKVASQSNCFIVLDADSIGIDAGETVTVEPFSAVL